MHSFRGNGKSLATYLYLLFSLSLTGTFFLSPSRFFDSGLGVWGTIYMCLSLYLVISPWKYFKVGQMVEIEIKPIELKFYSYLKIIGVLSLIVNLIVIYILGNIVDETTKL